MNEKQPILNANQRRYVKYLVWALVVLAIVLADLFGINLPDTGDLIPLVSDEQVYDFGSTLEDDTTFTTLATTGNVGVGGDLSVTGASTLSGAVTAESTIALVSDAYPLGYASSGSQLVYGTSTITGTATAAHGLTTVTFALCTLGEDPTSGAGDGAMCTATISANVVTLKVWQDDFVTAASEADVDVHWLVVGVP
jgi:hypothetical protein